MLSPGAVESSVNDRNRPCPTGGTGAHLYRETTHGEALGREGFEIVQFFDMAIADLASGAVPLPDQRCVSRLGVLLHRVNEWRIPAPPVGTGHAYATFQQVHCRLASHAAALSDIVGTAVSGAGARVHNDNLEWRKRVADALEFGFNILCRCNIAVG